MTPLFFGSSQRRLFGAYEPPRASKGSGHAVLLCQPWGQEYIRAHRSMRRLATLLTAAGCHVMRFDYFGTGDSGGEEDEADPAAAVADIETAAEGLQDMLGVARVALIGLRLGATLAARAAMRRKDNVDALVLWDPIIPPEEAAGMTRSLPARTLMLLTGTDAVLPGVTAESISAPIPWVEDATITGAVPVRVIQRITEWL